MPTIRAENVPLLIPGHALLFRSAEIIGIINRRWKNTGNVVFFIGLTANLPFYPSNVVKLQSNGNNVPYSA